MDVSTLTRGVSLCFALLLVVAIAHKGRALAANSASTDPVIATHNWSPRAAASVLAAAMVLEVVITFALFAAPAIGLIAVAMLLIVYSIELHRLEPNESCACLGELFNAPDRVAAIRRNLLLLAASVTLGASYAVGLLAVAPLSQSTIGVAAVVAAAVTAGQARGALVRSVSTTHQMPRGRGS